MKGHDIISNSCVIQSKNKLIINGKELPPLPKEEKGFSNCTVVNGDVYVNGYEWKDGKWQKTLKAFWHLIF